MAELTQLKCPSCSEYRRSFTGSHGIIAHLFFEHSMTGEDIQRLLLDADANGYHKRIDVLGEPPLTPDWWDKVTNVH